MIHEPVLVEEMLAQLEPQRGGLFVDCTVGSGGHSKAMLDAGATRVLGLDRDEEALRRAARALAAWGDRIELVHADFKRLPAVLEERGIERVDGALADLGLSSDQLEAEGRGFSFRRDEPLDMRFDRSEGPTAAELIDGSSEGTLADMIFQYGEERYSRRVARAIFEAHHRRPVTTTGQLAAIVRRAVPRRRGRIDPATKTFQALRIWVNRELDDLDLFLRDLALCLRSGARLAVITFHSLEDRIVKYALRTLDRGSDVALRVLTKRPIAPSAAEVSRNPRARSAKLRAAERLA